MKTWNCPKCGKETSGTYSEGGIPIAICEDCYQENYKIEANK